jgi:hypothetical protein
MMMLLINETMLHHPPFPTFEPLPTPTSMMMLMPLILSHATSPYCWVLLLAMDIHFPARELATQFMKCTLMRETHSKSGHIIQTLP